MYISNVSKRLRALNQPNDNDRKRWVWELIQNAKDSIAKDPQRSKVNVRIEIDGDVVRFRHDGNPFTMDARFGLLWKYSEDKENQESTGRFGTGFLTTHTLSKIVDIESNVCDNGVLQGFSVTMFRDGQTEAELLDGLTKMTESEKWYDLPFDWTTFTYKVSSESGRRAIDLGVESFNENIVRTMLFCKELGSVVLDNNGIQTTIERGEVREVGNGIFLKSFNFICDGERTTKVFLEKSMSEDCPELSRRYKADRKLRLDVALELKDMETLGGDENRLSYFCALPLVGIECQLDSPVIINSPDFEPDEERQSLLLNGIDWNEESDMINEVGINRLIFAKSVPLYEALVKYVSEHSFKNLHLLARGLKNAKEHDKLNRKWYEDEVLKAYREVLSKYEVVTPYKGEGALKISECVFVKEGTIDKENALFDLVTSTHGKQLAADNHAWSSMLWKEGLELWGLKEFCSEIQEAGNWGNIPMEGSTLTEWYNKFLTHVKTIDENLLKEYALIPDCNGDLKKKNAEGFKQGENISDFIIGLLAGFGQDMKGSLMNRAISSVLLESKYNSQSYSSDINKHVKDITSKDMDAAGYITALMPLISVVPDDVDKYGVEFIQKRKEYHRIVVELFGIEEKETKSDNSLLKNAWENLDEWIRSYCLAKIEKCGNLTAMPEGLGVTWLSDCIQSLGASADDLNKYKVLPNQNGVFCSCSALAYDDNIPACLKADVFKKIDIDIKSSLLHGDFDHKTSKVTDKKSISYFCTLLKDKYSDKSRSYNETTLMDVAFYVCSVLPESDEDEVEENVWKTKQNCIYAVAKQILPGRCTYDVSYIAADDAALWKDADKYVMTAITGKLESLGSLESLSEYLNDCGEKAALDLLNVYYSCGGRGTVFPDQTGLFNSLDDLKCEAEHISDQLKDVIDLIVPSDESYRHILADTRCCIQPSEKLTCSDAYKLIDDKIDGKFKVSENWTDPSFKEAVHLLIEEWADEKGSVWNADHFPKIFDKKDTILMNVLWTKEERQTIQKMKKSLTTESMEFIIANASEIMSLTNTISALEEENRRLRAMLEDNSVALTGADEGNVLTKEEIEKFSIEARTVVMQQMEREGFVFENGIGDYSVIDGVYKDGVEYPLVVKSCLGSRRRVYMTPAEWKQLACPNSMLWLYFGNGNAAPIKAQELFGYHDRLTLSFGTVNFTDTEKVDTLMEAFCYLKDVHLELVAVNPYREKDVPLEDCLFNR